jgi:hypothetical protein
MLFYPVNFSLSNQFNMAALIYLYLRYKKPGEGNAF